MEFDRGLFNIKENSLDPLLFTFANYYNELFIIPPIILLLLLLRWLIHRKNVSLQDNISWITAWKNSQFS